jgi:hypothetical protein
MKPIPLHTDDEWPFVLTLLPHDLEESARAMEALVRRRNIPDAAALVRLALAYAVSDLSLKDVAAWAGAFDVARITGPGLFYRLREAETWLERLLAQTLDREVADHPSGLRLRVVDATVINGPGAMGTQWRAHVLVDPRTGRFEAVQLTDETGGEGYARHPLEKGDVILGDRAYATARGVHAVRSRHAHVTVRLNPHTMRICGKTRRKMHLLSRAGEVPQTGGKDFSILIPIPPERQTKSHKPWRLEDAIAWEPARVTAGRTRTGEIIWVLSTLPATDFPPLYILSLYRFRWQIELVFKRLKSLLDLDALPSRQGPTAKSWMLAKFLAAAVAQKLVEPSGALSPWGYELREGRLYT